MLFIHNLLKLMIQSKVNGFQVKIIVDNIGFSLYSLYLRVNTLGQLWVVVVEELSCWFR